MRKPKWLIIVWCILLIIGIPLIQQPTAKAASAVVFGPPTEGTKITLAENSIDGPALAGFLAGPPKSVIAWTGTDAQHLLNYMTSNDGLHYSNKHTLGENSLWRPAVTISSGGKSPIITLAWTGTDSAHTLNLMSIDAVDFHIIKKVTLWGETSFTAPAVTRWGSGYILLSWAGTDSNHSLNTIAFDRTGQIFSKQILWGWSSHSRPDIQYDDSNGHALLAWTGPDLQLHDAQSADTIHWTLLSGTQPIPEWSNSAPSMIHATINMPPYWLAWTGLDSAHSLNVMYTENFPIWHNVGSKTTFHEYLLGGPELAYIGVSEQVIVAWTGAEAGHFLHVAVIYVRL